MFFCVSRWTIKRLYTMVKVVVMEGVFPGLTEKDLASISKASSVSDGGQGVIHMHYESVEKMLVDPVAQRILEEQGRRIKHAKPSG